MESQATRTKVLLAFAAVYVIWGSTYFFIREALDGFPPMMLGGLRFVSAALLMLAWCLASGQRIAPGRDLRNAAITGILLLFMGNGVVVWVEQSLPSSVVAIMIAVAPLAFVLLDKPQWSVNFRSWSVLLGIVAGFLGIWLLFSEKIAEQMDSTAMTPEVTGMVLMLVAIVAWPAGSLYAKYNPATIPPAVNTSWQMMAGGVCFLLASSFRGEWNSMEWSHVPLSAWGALAYLVLFGSIIGFSAYVWLLKVRSAAQVSTYAYVNPVVAVLFGVFLGHEHITPRQITGLVVILGGVLLINITKYRGLLRR